MSNELTKKSTTAVGELIRLGVPEATLAVLPPLLVLLGFVGSPVAWMAFGAAAMSGGLALRRAKEADETLRLALSDVGAEADDQLSELYDAINQVHDDAANTNQRVEATSAAVEELRRRLTPQQTEQVAEITEDYLRRVDEEWLAHLRKAIRVVATGSVPAGASRAVLAHLRTLSPEHVRGLEALWERTGSTSSFVSLATADPAHGRVVEVFSEEVEAALVACGFIEHQRASGGLNSYVTDRTFRITALGVCALRILSTKS